MHQDDREKLIAHFKEAYPDLVTSSGTYCGWVSNFHGATYDGQSVGWDLNTPEDRFALYCLASAWSRSGRWEGPVRLALAMSIEDGEFRDPRFWAKEDAGRLNEALTDLIDRGGRLAAIRDARNASARIDCAASFKVIGEQFDFIEETVERLRLGMDGPAETVKRLRSVSGTGYGDRTWRIKIPLILRELRCAGWTEIPNSCCCVPDARVTNAYNRLGERLPTDLLRASAQIADDFGDLYDLPPFFAPDLEVRMEGKNTPSTVNSAILANGDLVETDESVLERGSFIPEELGNGVMADSEKVVQALGAVFYTQEEGASAVIPTLAPGNTFVATLCKDGIEVDKLPGRGLLPWAAFCAALAVMRAGDGRAKKGSLQGGALGSPTAPFGSVEGEIASAVYGLTLGQNGTRRVTYVAGLMQSAGIADNLHGWLRLREEWT